MDLNFFSYLSTKLCMETKQKLGIVLVNKIIFYTTIPVELEFLWHFVEGGSYIPPVVANHKLEENAEGL